MDLLDIYFPRTVLVEKGFRLLIRVSIAKLLVRKTTLSSAKARI